MIICLRPQPDCAADISDLTALGIDALPLPMLTISYHTDTLEQLSRPDVAEGHQGLVITSKQASRALCAHADQLSDLKRLPVWCVGTASADQLSQNGYHLIHTGTGTARALAGAISQRAVAEDGSFLWLSGRDIHTDIGAFLAPAQIAVDRRILYQADPASPPAEAVCTWLASGGPVAAMVFSARTLTRFGLWLDGHAPQLIRTRITILAASAALAEQARIAGFTALQARHPDRASMLALCQDVCGQSASPAVPD